MIEANMATVDDCFKRPVIKAIADLAAGKPLQNITLEETLETINKNLALLAKRGLAYRGAVSGSIDRCHGCL